MTDYLQGVNNKERDSWRRLYDEYYSALCSYVNKFVKRRDEVEDIVQDTLVKIWHLPRRFETMQEFTWYLYRSAYNNSMHHLRTQKRHRELLLKYEVEKIEMPDEHFVITVREELTRQLLSLIDELPSEARKILLLSLEGLSGQEIADKLGISIHTVKSQKNRSYKFLRGKISRPYLLLYISYMQQYN